MKLRHIPTATQVDGRIDTSVPGYAADNPVVVVQDKGVVGPIAFVKEYEILEASSEEMNYLRIGGYPLKNEMKIVIRDDKVEKPSFGSRFKKFTNRG